MDLKKSLTKNLSKKRVNQIVDHVGDNPLLFNELVNIYLDGPYRITQRAAWPVTYCAENQPALVVPHIKRLLDFLDKPGIHDAVKRNTVRLLQFIEIPRRYHARVMSICFTYLGNPKEAVAIRVFSMTVLANLARHSPGIKNELRITIEDQLPFSSAAFISRAGKVLRVLQETGQG